MKRIFLILGLIILTPCNSQQKKEVKITKEQVVKNIGILREAGFFDKYNGLSDLKIFDKIYELRKQYYSEIFERPYEPDMKLDAIQIAQTDESKCLFLDLEADVGKGNNVYAWIIKAYSQLSNGKFKPYDIKEKWETFEGPIEISFTANDSLVSFNPKYEEDWLHESVFKVCSNELVKRKIRTVDFLSDNGQGFGQVIAIMRLTIEEQNVLENKLNWKFAVE